MDAYKCFGFYAVKPRILTASNVSDPMAVPPSYSDLGKSARDVFNKGYGKLHDCGLITFHSFFCRHLENDNKNISTPEIPKTPRGRNSAEAQSISPLLNLNLRHVKMVQ